MVQSIQFRQLAQNQIDLVKVHLVMVMYLLEQLCSALQAYHVHVLSTNDQRDVFKILLNQPTPYPFMDTHFQRYYNYCPCVHKMIHIWT